MCGIHIQITQPYYQALTTPDELREAAPLVMTFIRDESINVTEERVERLQNEFESELEVCTNSLNSVSSFLLLLPLFSD